MILMFSLSLVPLTVNNNYAIDTMSDTTSILSIEPHTAIHFLVECDSRLTERFRMYAYDAYFIKCAQQTDTPLLSLDKGLIHVAKLVGIEVLEV